MDEFDLSDLKDDIETTVQEILQSIRLGNSRLARAVKITITKKGSIGIRFKPYAININDGRRKGAPPPPVDKIRAWMRRNSIEPKNNNVTKQELAYILSASIGAKGIEPRPFLEAISKSAHELTVLYIDREIEKILKKSFKK